jgi:hypothetical protein
VFCFNQEEPRTTIMNVKKQPWHQRYNSNEKR